MRSPSELLQESAMRKILADKELRCFLMAIIIDDCRVFDGDFQTNANAYVTLAKQQIGKRLLEDMKTQDINLTHAAEREYRELADQVRAYYETVNQGETHGR